MSGRTCIFCGGTPVTREHVFRSSWKNTIEVSEGERAFVRYRSDGTTANSRPDPLFELVVKRVCAKCNNTWLNDLDSNVEPWLLDPGGESDELVGTKQFRRWAIKTAMLRACIEPRLPFQPEDDPRRLYAGDDIAEWHIFIGRAEFPEYRHAYGGYGPFLADRYAFGVWQVSWSIGTALVTAMREVGKHGAYEFKRFKHYNRYQGVVLAEISPNAERLPNVRMLPIVPNRHIEKLFWFFTTNSASPVADHMRNLRDMFETTLREAGLPPVAD